MGKLESLSKSKVVRILLNNGFKQVRSAKHITFKKSADGRVFTTWVPHHNQITVFVIQYIIKQTGKPREEFEV